MTFKQYVYKSLVGIGLLSLYITAHAEAPVAQSSNLDTIRNLSGAWFDYKQMGSGFNFVTMSDGKTFVYYYGYNKQGKPRWLLSEHPLGAVIPGEKQTLNMQYYPIMGAQGEDFADLEISFADCHNATANLVKHDGENKTYNLIPSFDNDSICIPVGQIAPPKKYTSELSGFNPAGVWYQPDHSGIGIHFIHAAERGNFAYFFGYDENDEQLWLLNRLHFNPFVKGIDQERDMRSFIEKEGDIKAIDWGKLILGFDQCDKGHALLISKDKITTRIDLNNMVLSSAVAGACRTGIDDRMTPPSKPVRPQKPKPKPTPPSNEITISAKTSGNNLTGIACKDGNDKEVGKIAIGEEVTCTAVEDTTKPNSIAWHFNRSDIDKSTCLDGKGKTVCTFKTPSGNVTVTAEGIVTPPAKKINVTATTSGEGFDANTPISCDKTNLNPGEKVTCTATKDQNKPANNIIWHFNISGIDKSNCSDDALTCTFDAPSNDVTVTAEGVINNSTPTTDPITITATTSGEGFDANTPINCNKTDPDPGEEVICTTKKDQSKPADKIIWHFNVSGIDTSNCPNTGDETKCTFDAPSKDVTVTAEGIITPPAQEKITVTAETSGTGIGKVICTPTDPLPDAKVTCSATKSNANAKIKWNFDLSSIDTNNCPNSGDETKCTFDAPSKDVTVTAEGIVTYKISPELAEGSEGIEEPTCKSTQPREKEIVTCTAELSTPPASKIIWSFDPEGSKCEEGTNFNVCTFSAPAKDLKVTAQGLLTTYTINGKAGDLIKGVSCDPSEYSTTSGAKVKCTAEPKENTTLEKVTWQIGDGKNLKCDASTAAPYICEFELKSGSYGNFDVIATGSTQNTSSTEKPKSEPEVSDGKTIAAIVEAVNAIRAQGRYCGPSFYPATQPISFNRILETAAIKHSKDMIARRFLAHTNPDGEKAGDRVVKEGYQYHDVNENIVVGSGDSRNSVDKALQAWLESPKHCRNLMSPDITEFGLGWAKGMWYYEGKSYPDGFFWTFVGAAPR